MLLLNASEAVSQTNGLLWLIPLLPLLGFVLNGLFGKRMSNDASGYLATAMIGGSFIISLIVFMGTFGEGNPGVALSDSFTWMSLDLGGETPFELQWRLRVDQLSAVMMLIITGVGSLIHLYSVGYMHHDKGYWKYFAYLNLFCFAMLCLVLGDNMVLLFLGWEGVGLCSYLLIGFWFTDMDKAKAGKKAFVANRVGDLGFLIGMFLLAWHFGSLEFEAINSSMAAMTDAAREAHSSLFNWACIFLFVGACGKSAQIPLYVWLPDAMAGPTPVSALIHAATMVTAGVYMCARMNMVMDATTWVLPAIALVGAVTALFAATIGLVQRDIKKVLAYSTVSQLGFMFMAVGAGAYAVAVFHLMTHAFFKAQLFLGSGSVIHAMEGVFGHHNAEAQDMKHMGGLKKKMPITCWTMVAGGMALAGIPLITAGFYSKDEILLNVSGATETFSWLADFGGVYGAVYWIGTIAAALTAFYTARLLGLTFFGEYRGPEGSFEKVHESPWQMTLPLAVLGVLSIVGGFINVPHGFGHMQFLTEFLGIHSPGHAAEGAHHAAATFTHHSGLMAQAGWDKMGDAETGGLIKASIIALAAFGAGLFIFSRKGMSFDNKFSTGGLKPIHNLLFNKYWVDELYEVAIIQPIRWGSVGFHIIIDVVIIDFLCVNLPAIGAGAFSLVIRRIQTGLVTHYLYFFAGGVVVLIAFLLT